MHIDLFSCPSPNWSADILVRSNVNELHGQVHPTLDQFLPLLCEVEERAGVRRRSGLTGKLRSMFNFSGFIALN